MTDDDDRYLYADAVTVVDSSIILKQIENGIRLIVAFVQNKIALQKI